MVDLCDKCNLWGLKRKSFREDYIELELAILVRAVSGGLNDTAPIMKVGFIWFDYYTLDE